MAQPSGMVYIFVLLQLLHMLMMLDRVKVYLPSIWDTHDWNFDFVLSIDIRAISLIKFISHDIFFWMLY